MVKRLVALILSSLLGLCLNSFSFAEDLRWENIGGGAMNLSAVAIEPSDPEVIFAAAGNSIIKTIDAGRNWENVFTIKGASRFIYDLQLDSKLDNVVYAATGNGLFLSPDAGFHWNKIFRGKKYLENECTSLAVAADKVYLGTKAGLFIGSAQGNLWQRVPGKLGTSYIYAIAYNTAYPDSLYLASVNGVFKTQDRGLSWKAIFGNTASLGEPDEEEQPEEITEDGSVLKVKNLQVDPRNHNCVYLATSKGAFKSTDAGDSWSCLAKNGLTDTEIDALAISNKGNIYALVKSKVFELIEDAWEELPLSFISGRINAVSFDYSDNIYIASERGLFKSEAIIREINYRENEPGVKELQLAAMKYAEVEPEKILNWRKKAEKKAWLPQLSVGVNRDVSDLWHWESGSTTKNGDDLLIEGDDAVAWDISLSWDLSELIWNDDQTSIDVRSRLMVQLRDDILEEVTRLYFERLRLKNEIALLSLEDKKKRFEKELKLQELTALLDAITGGYFLKNQSRNQSSPGLESRS